MFEYGSRFPGWSWKFYRPSELRFTHESIKSDFQDGHSLEETLESIVTGRLRVSDMQPLVVMEFRGNPYVVYGNRRLFLFKKLERYGYFTEVKVKKVPFQEELFDKMHSTNNAGKSVRIRGYDGCQVDSGLDDIMRRHRWTQQQHLVTDNPSYFRQRDGGLPTISLESASRSERGSPGERTQGGGICFEIVKWIFLFIVACIFFSALNKK